jgi:hypothetical protein
MGSTKTTLFIHLPWSLWPKKVLEKRVNKTS